MIQSEKTVQSAYQCRLLSATTPMTVTLAERKLRLGSLLALVPGVILHLETPCDEPLRLAIGLKTIGMVEAVKIENRLGVRICEMHDSKLR